MKRSIIYFLPKGAGAGLQPFTPSPACARVVLRAANRSAQLQLQGWYPRRAWTYAHYNAEATGLLIQSASTLFGLRLSVCESIIEVLSALCPNSLGMIIWGLDFRLALADFSVIKSIVIQ